MNHDSQLMVEPLLKRHLISPLPSETFVKPFSNCGCRGVCLTLSELMSH